LRLQKGTFGCLFLLMLSPVSNASGNLARNRRRRKAGLGICELDAAYCEIDRGQCRHDGRLDMIRPAKASKFAMTWAIWPHFLSSCRIRICLGFCLMRNCDHFAWMVCGGSVI
jgi:hypothetical protein